MLQRGKHRRQKNTIMKMIFLIVCNILFSSVLVAISVFISVDVQGKDELVNVKFGYPIAFITQNFLNSGGFGYEGDFPHRFKMNLDFLDIDPDITFSSFHFCLSVFIVFGIICLLYLFIIGIRRTIKK